MTCSVVVNLYPVFIVIMYHLKNVKLAVNLSVINEDM